MIEVTRINETKFLINSDIIETVEETSDTVITLTTGRKYIVKESCETIIDLVLDYKRKIYRGLN